MNVDLKAMYQEEAEELAAEGHLLVATGLITWKEDKGFYDLPEVIQEALYTKAIEIVHDKLASSADILRKEIG